MCPSPLFAHGCLVDARGTVGVRGPPGGWVDDRGDAGDFLILARATHLETPIRH